MENIKSNQIKISIEIIKYCAEEVERQQASPIDVYNMINAWTLAMNQRIITRALIINLGKLVCPEKNVNGFRKIPVMIGFNLAPRPELISILIENFVYSCETISPEELYKSFEEIHPFVDGNGRVGKILFNHLKGTLNNPIMPPNFWGIANP